MSESALSIERLGVEYQGQEVLADVTCEFPAGSLVGVIGPNGAGKSTLLKAVLGLVPTVSGDVRFFGQDYAAVRPRVAYVPQRESVDWDFPIRAVDVVAMGLYHRIGWFRQVRSRHLRVAREALQRMGIGELENRQISQLSGGQQQRVFLARAIAQDADLYLMDEPLSAVDAATEQSIIQTLREIRSAGKTALVVHHDLQTVKEYFDRVLVLNRRVIASGEVEATFTGSHLRAAYGGRLVFIERHASEIGWGDPKP